MEYMNEKLLTPLLLWDYYNPVKENFDLTFKKQYSIDGIKIRECYYTVKTLADGKIRGYMAMAIPEGEKGPFPAAVSIFDLDRDPDLNNAINAAKMGFVGVVIDYSGRKGKKSGFTSYPKSLSYCNVAENDQRIWRAGDNIKESAWFIWAQVLRRAISVLCKQTFIDKKRIALIGVGYATNLLWQVGTMDGRVSAMVAVNGAGCNGYGEHFLSVGGDESAKWLVGIASQAYMPYVHCPVMVIAPTNSVVTNFEKLFENVSYVSSKNKVNLIAVPNRRNQIDRKSFENIGIWLKNCFEGKSFPSLPVLNVRKNEKTFMLEAKCDVSELRVKNAEFYYAYGEENSSLRQWHRSSSFEKENGINLSSEIEFISKNDKVYTFFSVEYDNGIKVSSKELIITADSKADINENRRMRKIYAKNYNFDEFVAESNKLVASDDEVVLKKGYMDIEGISVVEGNLVSCIFSDIRYRGVNDSILQFDIYADTSVEVTVKLYADEEDGEICYSVTETVNSDKWEKLSFMPSDFKNSEMISLKDWKEVKRISFEKASDYIINNILWI